MPKCDSLFLLSELYSWEHLITTELQTDFAQWLRLKETSCYEGSQKFLRTILLSKYLDRAKYVYSAGGREDWKNTLEQQTFGFLRYVALFDLQCQKANCPKSSYMRTCLFDKQSELFKIPSFPGKMGVFPLWTLLI